MRLLNRGTMFVPAVLGGWLMAGCGHATNEEGFVTGSKPASTDAPRVSSYAEFQTQATQQASAKAAESKSKKRGAP